MKAFKRAHFKTRVIQQFINRTSIIQQKRLRRKNTNPKQPILNSVLPRSEEVHQTPIIFRHVSEQRCTLGDASDQTKVNTS